MQHQNMNLEEKCQIFMIKYFSPLLYLLLSSCSVDLGYIQLFRDSISENRIIVDDELIKSINSSFLKASKGRNDAIFVLSNSNNGFDTWIGSGMERIVTYKGFIVRTQGLDFDINHHNSKIIADLFARKDFASSADLTNPKYRFAELDFKMVESLNKNEDCYSELTYQKKIKAIGFSSKDWYCFDSNLIIWKSRQKLNPFDKDISLEFHYKF